MRNHTPVTEFLLMGIPHTQGLEHALFVFFLAFYLLTLVGNLLILLATLTSSNLHTPMYFFLGNLSVFDIFFPSVSSPKMMLYLLGQSQTISYQGCACQLFFYHFLGCTECFLYTVRTDACTLLPIQVLRVRMAHTLGFMMAVYHKG